MWKIFRNEDNHWLGESSWVEDVQQARRQAARELRLRPSPLARPASRATVSCIAVVPWRPRASLSRILHLGERVRERRTAE